MATGAGAVLLPAGGGAGTVVRLLGRNVSRDIDTAVARASPDRERARMIADFHFLRPEWLWGFVAAAILFWVVSQREDVRARWGSIISPRLLDHLIVDRREHRRLRPVHLTAALMALGSIA